MIKLLPESLTIDQMDAYLDHAFETYRGVAELIEWCARNRILFMINTTGFIGYFQRVFAKKMLPEIPVLSANPLIRFPASKTDPPRIMELTEITDKGPNTQAALKAHQISPEKIVIIGDSGGDGPHFKWGQNNNAFLVGSMTKPSLSAYCRRQNIKIDHFWGPVYQNGQKQNQNIEMGLDFNGLKSVLADIIF